MKKLILMATMGLLAACSEKKEQKAQAQPEQSKATQPKDQKMTENTAEKIITTPTGLQYVERAQGTGDVATKGKMVSVHYVGTLENGQKFDSSLDRGQPIEFKLGVGQVIPGWDEGLEGVKVGGKRKLIIPSDLAYGPRKVGTIPANSTLIFEVELMGVK